MPRVLTARFMHETNTFSRVKTDMALIRRRDFHLENEIPQAFRGTRRAEPSRGTLPDPGSEVRTGELLDGCGSVVLGRIIDGTCTGRAPSHRRAGCAGADDQDVNWAGSCEAFNRE